MRPMEVISDLAIRYSWSSYHPSALLWRISYWQSYDRFAALANMATDSSAPAFHWVSIIPTVYLQAWLRLLCCFSSKASNREKDEALQDVLPLFHNKSIDLPFRFLTDQNSQTIRSFVGNSFHPKLISIALGTPTDMQAWVKGLRPSTANIVDPITVRKNYLLLKQAIEREFAKRKYTPTSTLVQEPYRHHDFRALVMSPIDAPQVAQPTIGNLPPPYLTKDQRCFSK